MPELPEVETIARALREPLVGQTIVDVQNTWPRHIALPDLAELRARIAGQHVTGVGRRGKYIVIQLSAGDVLIIHLRMTGHLSVSDGKVAPDKHTHTIFELGNGMELRFRNPRKFGRVYFVEDPEVVLGKLGPEPLESSFTPERLKERLAKRKGALKPLLLDQTFVAGIGNIYADEALFYARLHPERRADSLTTAEIEALHAAIRKVLLMGIAREGASIDQYAKPDGSKGEMQNAVAVFRRTDQACLVCGTQIDRIVLVGRSTHYCPQCQKADAR